MIEFILKQISTSSVKAENLGAWFLAIIIIGLVW